MSNNNTDSTVRDCVQFIRDGALSSEALVKQCLNNIESSDSQVKAWAYVDAEAAIDRARILDRRRQEGYAIGRLHGIPVGVKDIVDTASMPTERGTSIYSGRQPDADAAVIDRLHEAGAIVLGKTVTCELAWMNESETRNPHNLERTPGGSSSGSAAAVAAGHVPLAVGSQTGGSVVRPASFNGVFGYKPSQGLISRRGVLQTSQSLDQLGVFGRDAGDVSLLVDVLSGFDPMDDKSKPLPQPQALQGYLSDAPVEPSMVWIDLPFADRYESDANEAFGELLDVIDKDTKASLDRIPAPESFKALIGCHQVIYDFEILRNFDAEWNEHREQLSESMRAGLTRAEGRSRGEYDEALGVQAAASVWFKQFFHDYDAIVTPSAIGIAPHLGQGTGDPVCCLIWTLCGLPCISLPLLTAQEKMPLGVQLVGAYDRDDRLMRTTNWLLNELKAITESSD